MRSFGILRALYLTLLCAGTYASSGDHNSAFRSCLSDCDINFCPPRTPLPLSLRLTFWTCLDNCKYECMHTITDASIAAHEADTSAHPRKMEQFYGKWPFWRLLGAQEPASVLFSLLNLWAHMRGLSQVRRRLPDDNPLKPYYVYMGYAGLNAWVWSAVFHTRDTPWTERFDYFSAALAILYSLFCAVVRLFHLYTDGRTRLTTPAAGSKSLLPIWAAICISAYICHVSYLTFIPKLFTSFPRFDYGYNMAANVGIGLIHNVFWLLYSIPEVPITLFPTRGKGYRPKQAYKPVAFVAITMAATSLELFDFPPWWRVLDAHSLWHLATVPIVPFWYKFLIEDALDLGWRLEKS